MNRDAVKKGKLAHVKDTDFSFLASTEEALSRKGVTQRSGSTIMAAEFCCGTTSSQGLEVTEEIMQLTFYDAPIGRHQCVPQI